MDSTHALKSHPQYRVPDGEHFSPYGSVGKKICLLFMPRGEITSPVLKRMSAIQRIKFYRELKQAGKDKDCFFRGTKGDYRCAARGMRILHECMYKNHGGDMGNDYCGPVLASLNRRIDKIKAVYGQGITERVRNRYKV